MSLLALWLAFLSALVDLFASEVPLQRFPFCVVYTSDPSPAGNLMSTRILIPVPWGTHRCLSLGFLDLSEQTSPNPGPQHPLLFKVSL